MSSKNANQMARLGRKATIEGFNIFNKNNIC
jgi:hypothetical protein